MLQNAVMEDISTAFEKLTIATETHDKDEDDSLFLIFQTYHTFFNRYSEDYKGKKRPDLDSITAQSVIRIY